MHSIRSGVAPCSHTVPSFQPRKVPRHVCSAAKQPLSKELVVGIDLGTTNSAVACIRNGKPLCLPNKHGDTLTPSVVKFNPDGSIIVGKEAKQKPNETTYYSVKRLIGRTFDDPAVQEEAGRLAFKVGVSKRFSAVAYHVVGQQVHMTCCHSMDL